MIAHPVDKNTIPEHLNTSATYMEEILKNAPHKRAAKDFYSFTKSETAEGFTENMASCQKTRNCKI